MALTPEQAKASMLRRRKERETQPPDISTGSMLTQAFFNAPASAAQFARDVVQPIVAPVETAKAVVNLGSSVLGKAGITDADPTLANQVGEYFANRYGGVNNAMQTFATDPVGMASDVAGLLTGGGTVVAKLPGRAAKHRKALEAKGRTVDPVYVAAETV